MILYSVIKYSILSYCLESLFDNLVRNLKEYKLDRVLLADIKAGMEFRKILVFGAWYQNCKITTCVEEIDIDNVTWNSLEFTYSDDGFGDSGNISMSVSEYDENEGYIKFIP